MSGGCGCRIASWWRGRADMRLILAGLLALWPMLAGAQPRITDLVPIQLRPGVNLVENFTADGRAAQVVQAWRENGNAYSHDIHMVLLPSRPGATDWAIVALQPPEPNAPLEDVIRDAPHTGEDAVRVVRLVRARVDGVAAPLLVIATRDPADDGSIAGPSLASIDVYRLTRGEGVGTTREYFTRFYRTRSRGRYCHVEAALAREFNIPPRRGAGMLNSADGCPG